MNTLSIYKGKDLKNKSLEELVLLFGKSGKHYYNVVEAFNIQKWPHRIAKSVAVEETFWEDLLDEDTVFEKIDEITDELFRRLERSGIKGKTLTLKIKYKDFTLFTRSKTESQYLENKFSLSALAKQLWQSRPFDKPIRLLGLSLSNLNTEEKKQVSVQLKIPFPEFL